MADERGYDFSTELVAYDGDVYFNVDKSGFTRSKKYKADTLKDHFKVGDQTYTEQNYVTDSETLTASVDALDIALNDVADNVSNLISIKTKVVSLSQSDILTLNSVPVELIAAAGANQVIELLSVTAKLVYNSSSYVSANELRIVYSGETNGIMQLSTTFLTNGASVTHRAAWTSNVLMTANTAVKAYVHNANPTAGDSTIKLFISYRIIDTGVAPT